MLPPLKLYLSVLSSQEENLPWIWYIRQKYINLQSQFGA